MTNRDQLILDHLRRVELLAGRLHRRYPQVELDDLISIGTVGLIRAVDRFDPSRNLKPRGTTLDISSTAIMLRNRVCTGVLEELSTSLSRALTPSKSQNRLMVSLVSRIIFGS